MILNFNIFAEGENEIFTETAEEKPICRAFVLGDTKGNIYYSENENEMLPLASVTKVMTLI
ncbi:MAG: D-alanyl-D-alanine carboxypeptidase, partial [Fusobacterium sp.]